MDGVVRRQMVESDSKWSTWQTCNPATRWTIKDNKHSENKHIHESKSAFEEKPVVKSFIRSLLIFAALLNPMDTESRIARSSIHSPDDWLHTPPALNLINRNELWTSVSSITNTDLTITFLINPRVLPIEELSLVSLCAKLWGWGGGALRPPLVVFKAQLAHKKDFCILNESHFRLKVLR